MKKSLKIVLILISFVLLILLITGGLSLEKNKKIQFQAFNEKVVSFADTTVDRVAKSVVTLPEGSIIVGLNNNVGSYTSTANIAGKIQIQSELLKTNFISGIYGKRDPRLDAIVPMYVSADSYNGSTYIVLFNDRGDVALEKSYARLGDRTVSIESIKTLPADKDIGNEDYKVDITYKVGSAAKSLNTKELIVPIIGGLFDPSRVTTSDRTVSQQETNLTTRMSTLEGHMTIGPICPVEKINNPCLPTPEMYANKKVYVYKTDRKTLVKTMTPDSNGNFSVLLPTGIYYVDIDHQSIGSITGVPTTIEIKSGSIVTLSIGVDTGIR